MMALLRRWTAGCSKQEGQAAQAQLLWQRHQQRLLRIQQLPFAVRLQASQALYSQVWCLQLRATVSWCLELQYSSCCCSQQACDRAEGWLTMSASA